MTLRAGLAPLREQAFRALFFGRTVSSLGSAVAPIALAFAVLDLTGSPAALGIVLGANVAPQVLLLVVGGVVADRLPRGRVMVLANVVSAAGQGATATLLIAGEPTVWQLAALAAVTGSATAFFGPASQGVLPQTVPAERLQEANALIRLVLNIVKVMGPAAGGVAVAVVGPGWALAWDALTFAVAAVVLSTLRVTVRSRSRSRLRFGRALREGWSEFWSRTWLWVLVIQYSLINMIWVGGFLLLGPVVADSELGGPAAWGLIAASLAAGLVVGGFVMLFWRPSRPLLVGTFATMTKTAPLVALALSAPLPVVMLSTVVAGIGVEVFTVCFSTVMHQRIPEDRMSRVSSYDMLLGIALMPLGYVIAGPLAQLVGVGPALVGGAVLIAGSSALVLLSGDIRTIRSRRAEPDVPAVATASAPVPTGAAP